MGSYPHLPAAALAALVLLAGCTGKPSPEPPKPPIVLLTYEGLRADALAISDPAAADSSAARPSAGAATAAEGPTPILDRFFAEADWAGRAVAPSSRPGTSGASLATGLTPWKHQVLQPADRLSPRFVTLAETLSSLGYSTAGYFAGHLTSARGFQQGFDSFHTLYRALRARSHLRSLRGDPEFLWIHLHHPSPPWLRRDWLFPDGVAPPGLPKNVTAEALAPYRDGRTRPSEAELERLLALYRNNLALADVLLGRFLEEIRTSGHWDEVLLAVTSTQGLELGEERWIGTADRLSRQLLEVPLAIKLPSGFDRRLTPQPGERVALVRLFATLVEAAGGRAPAGVAPGLFQPARDAGVLSELYAVDGRNVFSWLEGDHQLLRHVRFAPAGVPAAVRAARFRKTPPFRGPDGGDREDGLREDGASGNADGDLEETLLLRWVAGGVEPVDDPELERRLAAHLTAHWASFQPRATSPARESEDLLLRP